MPGQGRGRGRGRGGRGRGRGGRGGQRNFGRLPGVCLHYTNPSKKCVKGDSCNFLHVCRNIFDDDGCTYRQCRFSHNFTDDQPSELLKQYNIDPDQDWEELVERLRKRIQAQLASQLAYKDDQRQDSGGDEEVEDEDGSYGAGVADLGPALHLPDDNDDDSDAMSAVSSLSFVSNTSQQRNPRRQRRRQRGRNRKLSAAGSMDGLSDTSEVQPNSPIKQDEICTFHVKARCTNGDNCPKLHRPSKLPYQWQVLRNKQWKHFDDQLNKRIEKAFCDPSIDNIGHVKVGKQSYTIEFDTMTMFQPKSSHIYQDIRRLCTLPSIFNQIKNMLPYCTHWVWYWENTQGKWEEYSKENPSSATDNDTLERAYQNYLRDPSKQTIQISSGNSIDFESMNQQVPRQPNLAIRRRPVLYTKDSDQSSKSGKSTNSANDNSTQKAKKTVRISDQDKTQKPKPPRQSSAGKCSDVKMQEAILPVLQPKLDMEPLPQPKMVIKPQGQVGKLVHVVKPQESVGNSRPMVKPQEAVGKPMQLVKPKESASKPRYMVKPEADTMNPLTASRANRQVPPYVSKGSVADGIYTKPQEPVVRPKEKHIDYDPTYKSVKDESVYGTLAAKTSEPRHPKPAAPKEGEHSIMFLNPIDQRQTEIKHNLQTNYVSKPAPLKAFAASSSNVTSGSRVHMQGATGGGASSSSVSKSVEICTKYTYSPDYCPVSNCSKLHVKSVFQWQFKVNSEWENFDDKTNPKLEDIFCRPNDDSAAVSIRGFNFLLNFKVMTVSSDCLITDGVIRRISTMSTVRCSEKSMHAFCIEWKWHWKDEFGNWIEYAQKNSKSMQSDVNADDLEIAYHKYLENHSANIYPFRTNRYSYHLDFKTMLQKNLEYHTHKEREVRRRPKFVTLENRWKEAHLSSSSSLSQVRDIKPDRNTDDIGSHKVPETWDMDVMSPDKPKLIALDADHHVHEYYKVADVFWNTMDDKGANINSIKRVQNLELWQDFSIKKERMTKKNRGQPVLEKLLWHGTKKESSEAICRQNFDFRISGSNVGTLYGQGSYFARDAQYSNSYSTSEEGKRRMFLVRVLVGSFVAGKKEYKRPPPKDPSEPLGDLYDACVDKEHDPSIFVIFEKAQAYPEYLIEYEQTAAQASFRKQPAAAYSSVSRSSSASNVRSYTTVPSYPSPTRYNQPAAAPRPASSHSNISAHGNPSSGGMGSHASSTSTPNLNKQSSSSNGKCILQ